MGLRTATPGITLSRGWRGLAGVLLLCEALLSAPDHAQAQGFGSPDECQAYTGDAHVQCLYAYIEMQQKRLAQIDEAIHGQLGDMEQRRQQIDRQATPPQEIPQSVSDRAASQAYSYPQ